MAPSKKPTFEEYLACSELAFEWAESYDDKDWDRLRGILAPTLTINYAGVNAFHDPALPASSFIAMMANPLFLGDANIDSQHMLGLAKWEKVSQTEIVSWHQSRAAHVRWEEGGMGWDGSEKISAGAGAGGKAEEGERRKRDVNGGEGKKETGGRGETGERKTVAAKGHGHGMVEMYYRKVGGERGGEVEWKWAGIKTKVRWNEYEFERVFRGSAGKGRENGDGK